MTQNFPKLMTYIKLKTHKVQPPKKMKKLKKILYLNWKQRELLKRIQRKKRNIMYLTLQSKWALFTLAYSEYVAEDIKKRW